MGDEERSDRIALEVSFEELIFLNNSIGVLCNGDLVGVHVPDAVFRDWLHISREGARALQERISKLVDHLPRPTPDGPGIFLWVEAITHPERREAVVLHGFDFREALGMEPVDIPSDLYAIRRVGRSLVRGADIAHVHRFSQGWEWETKTPEQFPEPPFLLTDDESCGIVYDGPVLIHPTDDRREFLFGRNSYGTFSAAAAWQGVVWRSRR